MKDGKTFNTEDYNDAEEMLKAAKDAGLSETEAIQMEIASQKRALAKLDTELANHAKEMEKLNALKNALVSGDDEA